MNESRKEFEEWATENRNAYFPDFTRANDKKDDYYGVATQAAWEAWQAAREKPIKLPMRQEPRYEYDTGPIMELSEYGNYLDVDEVKQEIEAAGYRWE